MGDPSQTKVPRGSNRGYKPPYGKDKGRGRKQKSALANSKPEQKHVASMKEISDITFKELRVLGSQKFGSSPFSEHFNRWLANLAEVLSEFESNPNINSDDEFVKEREQIISEIKTELEQRRRKEASIDEANLNLSNNKNLLERINTDYVYKMRDVKTQKNREVKRLRGNINHLEEELDNIVRMKTGFFRGVSKKERERREAEKTQELDAAQREFELVMLKFTQAQERIRDEFEGNRRPVIEQARDWQKKIQVLEMDGSREDRWFACEALIDAVNALLERKTIQQHKPD